MVCRTLGLCDTTVVSWPRVQHDVFFTKSLLIRFKIRQTWCCDFREVVGYSLRVGDSECWPHNQSYLLALDTCHCCTAASRLSDQHKGRHHWQQVDYCTVGNGSVGPVRSSQYTCPNLTNHSTIHPQGDLSAERWGKKINF